MRARAPYAERSLAIRQRIDDRWGIAQSLTILGDIARATNDHIRARSYYRDALTIHNETNNQLGVAECIERLAQLMTDRQAWASAARCFGATRAVRKWIGAPVLPVDRLALERAIADTRAALGDDAFRAAYDAGRATDMREMVTTITPLDSPISE